jgi:cell wall-associated NlpC family hydrolase
VFVLRTISRRLGVVLLTTALALSAMTLLNTSRADAAAAFGQRVVAAAKAQKGKPYGLGSAGPRAFDCSGLVRFSYRRAGVRLPRTAAQQYRSARKVSRRAARPGDLVFWLSGGNVYHVGIYAGGNRVWHAPKPGDRVELAKIWTSVRFGRVRR